MILRCCIENTLNFFLKIQNIKNCYAQHLKIAIKITCGRCFKIKSFKAYLYARATYIYIYVYIYIAVSRGFKRHGLQVKSETGICFFLLTGMDIVLKLGIQKNFSNSSKQETFNDHQSFKSRRSKSTQLITKYWSVSRTSKASTTAH